HVVYFFLCGKVLRAPGGCGQGPSSCPLLLVLCEGDELVSELLGLGAEPLQAGIGLRCRRCPHARPELLTLLGGRLVPPRPGGESCALAAVHEIPSLCSSCVPCLTPGFPRC